MKKPKIHKPKEELAIHSQSWTWEIYHKLCWQLHSEFKPAYVYFRIAAHPPTGAFKEYRSWSLYGEKYFSVYIKQ